MPTPPHLHPSALFTAITRSAAIPALLLSTAAALATPLPIQDFWDYNSADGIDYREVASGAMTVEITAPGIVARTFPPGEYAVDQDFTVSIYFSGYEHQGPNSDPGSFISSAAGISLNWDTDELDPIGGDPLTANLSLWRGTWSNDDSEHYQWIYGLNNQSYSSVRSFRQRPTSDTFGALRLSKQGRLITATVTDSGGTEYSELYTIDDLGISTEPIWIGIDTANGPYTATSVHYSGLDMEPEPVKPRLYVAITGGGTVSSDPGGIQCGNDCEAPFDEGTPITLQAIETQGQAFNGWTGGCGGITSCTLTLDEDTAVVAAFGESLPEDSLVLQQMRIDDVLIREAGALLMVGPGVEVVSGGDLSVRAGERVRLLNGFRVYDGGRFQASADPTLRPY